MMPLHEYVISEAKRSFLTQAATSGLRSSSKASLASHRLLSTALSIWEWLTCSRTFPVYQGSMSSVARIGRSVSKMNRSAALFSK